MISAILLSLTSCATSTRGIKSFCAIYEPVHFSRHDTPETISEVQRNNAAYETLCK